MCGTTWQSNSFHTARSLSSHPLHPLDHTTCVQSSHPLHPLEHTTCHVSRVTLCHRYIYNGEIVQLQCFMMKHTNLFCIVNWFNYTQNRWKKRWGPVYLRHVVVNHKKNDLPSPVNSFLIAPSSQKRQKNPSLRTLKNGDFILNTND